MEQLHRLGIDTICDLRANDERHERPTVWHDGTSTDFWTRDHEFSAGSLAELVTRPDLMAEHTRDSMYEIYSVIPYEQNESYRELLVRAMDRQTLAGISRKLHCAVLLRFGHI